MNLPLSKNSTVRKSLVILAASFCVGGLSHCSNPGGTSIGTPPSGLGKGTPPAEKTKFQINDVWTITSRTCNGAATPLQVGERFAFDASKLVRIETEPSSATQACEMEFAYDRVIQNSSTNATTYLEQSSANSNVATEKCYRVANGHVINTVISTRNLPFGPEQIGVHLELTGSALTASLTGATDCTEGILEYKMIRR